MKLSLNYFLILLFNLFFTQILIGADEVVSEPKPKEEIKNKEESKELEISGQLILMGNDRSVYYIQTADKKLYQLPTTNGDSATEYEKLKEKQVIAKGRVAINSQGNFIFSQLSSIKLKASKSEPDKKSELEKKKNSDNVNDN